MRDKDSEDWNDPITEQIAQSLLRDAPELFVFALFFKRE